MKLGNYNVMVDVNGDLVEYEDDDMDFDFDDAYTQNAPCDNSGFCTGSGCPFFYTCGGM